MQVFKLITRDTIEERIDALIRNKVQLMEEVVAPTEELVRGLSRRELAELLLEAGADPNVANADAVDDHAERQRGGAVGRIAPVDVHALPLRPPLDGLRIARRRRRPDVTIGRRLGRGARLGAAARPPRRRPPQRGGRA